MYVYRLTYHILSIQNYYIRGGRGGKRRGRQIMYIYVIIYIQYIHMYSTICMHIYLYMPVVICTCR